MKKNKLFLLVNHIIHVVKLHFHEKNVYKKKIFRRGNKKRKYSFF